MKRNRKLSQDGAFNADQAELRAIRDGEASVGAGTLDEKVTGEAYDEGVSETDLQGAPFTTPNWQKDDVGLISLDGKATEVVQERRSLLGNAYPFIVDGAGIKYSPSKLGIYEFCLATCDSVTNSTLPYKRLTRHFERVVKSLLIAYCGPGTCGFRFGWPSESYFDRQEGMSVEEASRIDKDIESRIKQLRTACKFFDEEWRLSVNRFKQRAIDRAKDARIDVVVRRPLMDDRPGGLTLVGQCGCGKDDVRDGSRKHEELTRRWLKHYFDDVTIPEPIFVFATSQHVASHDQIADKQLTGEALLLDRIRLVKLAVQNPDCIENEKLWMKKLTDYVITNPPVSSYKKLSG